LEQERAKYAAMNPDLDTAYKSPSKGSEFALPATGDVVVVVDGGMDDALRYVRDNPQKTAVTMPIFEWDEIKTSPGPEGNILLVSVEGHPGSIGFTGDGGALLKSLNKI
jgi:hypothetical protein